MATRLKMAWLFHATPTSHSEESLFKVILLPTILLSHNLLLVQRQNYGAASRGGGKPLRIFNPLNASIQ
jgi:hypothetical protein